MKYVPSNYQWELVRQNIKFILLFIDKVQITLSNLISQNRSYIQSNKYEIFINLWEECNNKFPKYSVLFTILDNLQKYIVLKIIIQQKMKYINILILLNFILVHYMIIYVNIG